MRFVVYERIWHGFDVLYHHLLLIMDFDCPLAFCHKKGEYILSTYQSILFLFSGGEYFFVGWSLWICLDCIQVLHFVLLLFQLLPHLLCVVEIFMIGGVCLFYMFLISNCLLIYVYEFLIDICLYCVLFGIKILFFFTCIFSTHAVMHFV